MKEAEAKATDRDVIPRMEAPTPEFENESKWADIAMANVWTPYGVVSQPTDDKSIYKG